MSVRQEQNIRLCYDYLWFIVYVVHIWHFGHHIVSTRVIHTSVLINTVNGSMRLHLVLYTVSFRWQISFCALLTPRKSLTINSDGSISASDSKMHKIYRNKISSKVQLYLSNSYKILTSREKWRHTLRVDKACPQKQLHKHNRKHNVCVAGNLFDHNNNSLLMHIYLSRYSASLASMRWC